MFEGKHYWLIGASEGLGRALAQALSHEGAEITVSARNGEKLNELASSLQNCHVLPIDVTDDACTQIAAQNASQFDGVIYLAGAYDPLHAQDWDQLKIMQMFDVNLMGAVRTLGPMVESFTARDQGHIVIIGSLAGFQGLPKAMGYGASKAGLMHFGETLYADLRRTGVKVQNINPGFVKTRLTDKNNFNMPQVMTPEDAALRVIKAMKSDRFSTSFPWPFSWLFTLGKFLPYRWFLKLMPSSS